MSPGTFIVLFHVSAGGLTGILVEMDVALVGVLPFYLAIAVGLVANTGSKTVIDGQIRDFLYDKPPIAIASDA